MDSLHFVSHCGTKSSNDALKLCLVDDADESCKKFCRHLWLWRRRRDGTVCHKCFPPRQKAFRLAASTGPKEERNLQNWLQNQPRDLSLSVGAGEGNRTLDIQLGKLSFYH